MGIILSFIDKESKSLRERITRLPAKFYNENANELALQYLSTSFDKVHQSWHQLLPAIINNPNARILDIGAGRDAKYIAQSA